MNEGIMPERTLILHDIRSVYNVGAIFRTADAAGVSHVYLTGYTPAPIDRFGRVRADFVKCSLGAEKNVMWSTHDDVNQLISELKNKGVCAVAYEQDKRSVPYTEVALRQPSAYVFGNEVSGLPDDILNAVDIIAEIPMRGMKESLNVSVVVGIALFN